MDSANLPGVLRRETGRDIAMAAGGLSPNDQAEGTRVTACGRNRGMGRNLDPKYLCQICEDIAVGYHCGAFICEACKKFYLRCMKSGVQSSFSCSKSNTCEINKDTRSHCQFCRFQKCVQVGMYKSGRNESKALKVDFASIACKVCDAPSSGFHFGAITCEGCKGFFRRTINENAQNAVVCLSGGQCPIGSSSSRGACKACRFARCKAVGMTLAGTRLGRQSNSVKRTTILQYKLEVQAAAAAQAGVGLPPVAVVNDVNRAPIDSNDKADAAKTKKAGKAAVKKVSRANKADDFGDSMLIIEEGDLNLLSGDVARAVDDIMKREAAESGGSAKCEAAQVGKSSTASFARKEIIGSSEVFNESLAYLRSAGYSDNHVFPSHVEGFVWPARQQHPTSIDLSARGKTETTSSGMPTRAAYDYQDVLGSEGSGGQRSIAGYDEDFWPRNDPHSILPQLQHLSADQVSRQLIYGEVVDPVRYGQDISRPYSTAFGTDLATPILERIDSSERVLLYDKHEVAEIGRRDSYSKATGGMWQHSVPPALVMSQQFQSPQFADAAGGVLPVKGGGVAATALSFRHPADANKWSRMSANIDLAASPFRPAVAGDDFNFDVLPRDLTTGEVESIIMQSPDASPPAADSPTDPTAKALLLLSESRPPTFDRSKQVKRGCVEGRDVTAADNQPLCLVSPTKRSTRSSGSMVKSPASSCSEKTVIDVDGTASNSNISCQSAFGDIEISVASPPGGDLSSQGEYLSGDEGALSDVSSPYVKDLHEAVLDLPAFSDIRDLRERMARAWHTLDCIIVRPVELEEYKPDPSDRTSIWNLAALSFMHHIKSVLKFVKQVPGFTSLPVEDQIIMVQISSYPLSLLYHTQFYNPNTGEGNFFINTPEEYEFVFAQFPLFRGLLHHFQHSGQMLHAMNLTDTEYGLMAVIALFLSGVKPFDKTVQVLTDFFTGVLLDYCEETSDDPNRGGMLLLRLGELYRFNCEHLGIAMKSSALNPDVDFSQLWHEMFLNY